MIEPRIMAHLVASFPNWEASLEVGKGLVDGGAAFLEVQFPFSDPTADGPHIQVACDGALAAGFTVAGGFELVAALRAYTDLPIAVMSYANPIFQNGVAEFVRRCRAAGANAVIAPDLPPDYDEGLYAAGAAEGVQVIPVVVPSTVPERLRMLVQSVRSLRDTEDRDNRCSGIACWSAFPDQGRHGRSEWIYTALRKGITGSYTEIGADNLAFLQAIRELGGSPLAGFGIRERSQVDALAPHVAYVVVGTWFVQLIREHPQAEPRALMAQAVANLLPDPQDPPDRAE